MMLSILFMVLSVVAMTVAKPADSEAHSQLTVVNGEAPMSLLLYSGTFESESETLVGWGFSLNPIFRVEGFVLENVQGIRITLMRSGLRDINLLLNFRRIPGTKAYFNYRFYGHIAFPFTGIANDQTLLEKFKPYVQITTEEL